MSTPEQPEQSNPSKDHKRTRALAQPDASTATLTSSPNEPSGNTDSGTTEQRRASSTWPAKLQADPPRTARLVVGLLVALTALLAFFAMAPEDPYEDARSSIEANDDANNARTEGAPQQEVVNGWTTIEYLNLISMQQEQADDRRDALLLIGLVGAGATLATSRLSRD